MPPMINVVPTPQKLPEPIKVIVADDEVLVRLVLADELREAGFRVFEAANAEQVIAILGTTHIDVVVTDLKMRAQEDGLVVADYVRVHHPEIPVLLASGKSPAINGYHFDAFFTKPYRPKEVTD
jgi:DNA-binding NtrC family response regulator